MRRFLLLFFALGCLSASAQLNNTMFDQRKQVSEQDSGSLFLNFNALGFNKNNEYFGKIADGYTLFGYQVNPSLAFMPTAHTRFDVGVYAQKDFGNDDYTEVQPTFTFTYKMGSSRLIFGTLEGATSHQLIEPLYDFENVLVNRLENGLQFNTINDWLFFDVWLDWQNMLYAGENDQEELTGGLSARYFLVDKIIRVSIPAQLVVKHLGGQIDVSDRPLQTYVNTATGITLDFLRPDNNLINSVRLDSYYVTYSDASGEQLRPFEDGDGFYINAEVKSKIGLEFMVSYWQANEFLSIQGGQIYPSESSTVKNPFVIQEDRELVILRFMHNMKLSDRLTLSSRFEPYFDLINDRFEFSHAFYLNYTTDFRLLKGKK
ncbi:MAG: hypothetical protein RLO81_06050 [Fulvivirga sp.]|uniref:hypothetical protein n=1 Tax=Fulvivirga sp. TaxID=1931237 RepID=UPI0032EDEFF7